MFIKPCPKCSRLPKIYEGISRNGHRFYSVHCPNYCWVLRKGPRTAQDNCSWSFISYCLYFNEDVDYNTMYKEWNKELIDER